MQLYYVPLIKIIYRYQNKSVVFPFQTLKYTVYPNKPTYILSTTPINWGETTVASKPTSVTVNQDIESRKHLLKRANINILTHN